MRKYTKKLAALLTVAALSLSGCGSSDKKSEKTSGDSAATETTDEYDRETVYQVSLLQSLTLGNYHGSVSVGELKKRGDIGIGTFDALNGELIAIDGGVYRASSDGSIKEIADDITVPFSDVTFFDEDVKETLSGVEDITALQTKLDEKVDELGKNKFYFIRLDGTFTEMNARSEYAQSEPYKPLADVMETDQKIFDYQNIEGTVVGLYCPPYMSNLNAVGWHFHFISADKTKGGHVLGLKFGTAELSMDVTDKFEMILPDDEMFKDSDLTVDQSEDIEKVEKNTSDEEEEKTTEEKTTEEPTTEEPTTEENAKKDDKNGDDKKKANTGGPEMDSSDFVLISEAVPDALLEIRYATTHNFVGEVVAGYEEPVGLITKEAAAALKDVNDELKEKGYKLKIYDAYRPQQAVDFFLEWSKDANDTKMKDEFYPEINKSDLYSQGYVAKSSGHSRGSTVDLTLYDIKADKDVDMGGTFDYFGEKSHYDYAGITEEQKANRKFLKDVMTAHGFKPYSGEWWHFTLENEPFPNTYFNFPVSSDSVRE